MKSSLFKLSIVIAIVIVNRGSRGCSPGWVSFRTSCYRLYSERITWHQARDACEAQGSHLVTYGSAEESAFVYQTLAKAKSLWIGLYRNPVDFSWVTNESLVYQNWISPSGDSLDEHCVEVTDYSPYHGMWNDLNCDRRLGYICEQAVTPVNGIFEIKKGVSLYGHVVSELNSATLIDCVLRCMRIPHCKSVNYFPSFLPAVCQLNNAKMKEFPDDAKQEDAAYYAKMFG